MEKQHELSAPITIRLPKDVLADIEEIARSCDRSRSWVLVRALKSYLAGEGREILDIVKARQEIEAGDVVDLDDLIADLDTTKGAAA